MVLSAGFDDQRQAPIAGGNEVGNPASRSASCRDRHFRHDLVCGSLGSERRRIENHFGHFEVGCDGRTGDVGWPGVRAAEPRQLDILPTDESGGFLNWPELHAATSRVVPAAAGGGLTRAALLPGLAPCPGVGAGASPRATMFSAALMSA